MADQLQENDHSHNTSPHRISIVGGGLLIFLAVLLNYVQTLTSGWANWAIIFFGVCILVLIVRFIPLEFADIGIERKYAKSGIKFGLLFALLVWLLFFVTYIVAPDVFVDSRYNGSAGQIAFSVLVFIPLHTVLLEELLFRGAMLGYFLKRHSQNVAIISSSLLFGLWHILPSLGLAESSRTLSTTLGTEYSAHIISVIGAVVATSVAGVVFCLLRIRSKSLVAPIIAHWSINAGALLFASLAS